MKSYALLITVWLIIPLKAFNQTDKSCEEYRSLYFQYLQNGAYNDARNFWVLAYQKCKTENSLDEGLFINGLKIYEHFKEIDPENQSIKDSIYWIYDERFKVDLDPRTKLKLANTLFYDQSDDYQRMDSLFNTIQDLPEESNPTYLQPYFLHFVKNHFVPSENKEELKPVFNDLYFDLLKRSINGKLHAIEIEDEKTIAKQEKFQEVLIKYFLLLNSSKEDLDSAFETNLSKIEFSELSYRLMLENGINVFEQKGYTNSFVYTNYVLLFVEIDPSASGYLQLGKMYIEQKIYKDAINQLEKAGSFNSGLKNEINYYLSVAHYGAGNYEKAFYTAKQISGKYKGKSYIICGDCIAAKASSCGDSTFERKASYWLANDYYQKAKNEGESVSSSAYLDKSPTESECFNEGYDLNQSVTIQCWNEKTTVRY